MKKFNVLLLVAPLLISGCAQKDNQVHYFDNDVSNPTISFAYKDPEEVAINVTKAGVEIMTVDVINIPNNGIQIGKWDEAEIKLHVTYNDATTEDFPLMVKHLPIETRRHLGEIGHHNIEILANGHTVKFGFNVINNPDFHGYVCRFYDSYSQGIVFQTTVGYYQDVLYGGKALDDHPVGTEFMRHFVGWDYPLTNVHQDMEYRAVYRDAEKRFYGDSLLEGQNHVVSTYKDSDTYHVLAYLGRVHRVALNYSDTIYHKQGDEAATLSFKPLILFNQRWEQLNKDIVKYGLKYSFDNTAGQYLFGTNTGFNNSPIFLSNFESMYDQTSYSVTLDTEAVVTTSSLPNYATVYAMADDHKEETVTVTSDLEDGYYRVAVVANFDVYMSVSFNKLANGKYSVDANSKFMFSPVSTSVDVLAQHSETEDFGSVYDKKVEFSNKVLYDIAVELEWED